MANPKRQIKADLPRYPIVSPEGLIKMVAVADNIRGALEIDRETGIPVMSRAHERRGWVWLQKLYEQIDRLDLWADWQSWRVACDAARKLKQDFPAFPDEYLPPEVMSRRAGNRPNTRKWTMPARAPIQVDAPPADKPATSRSKKDA